MYFGSIEHEIAGEIARIANAGDSSDIDHPMPPVDWERLGRFRQHEIIEMVTKDPGPNPLQVLLWQAGSVLVSAGQKMMQTANRMLEVPKTQNAAAPVSSEDC
jgi:hypothetical protein